MKNSIKMKSSIVCFCFLLPLVFSQNCDDICNKNVSYFDPDCLIEGSHSWRVPKSEITEFFIPSVPAFLLQLNLQGNFSSANTTMTIDVFQFQPNATKTCRMRFAVSIVHNTSCNDASCNTGRSNHDNFGCTS